MGYKLTSNSEPRVGPRIVQGPRYYIINHVKAVSAIHVHVYQMLAYE